MWDAEFWKDAAGRAIRTAAQVLLSVFVVGETSLLDVDYLGVLGLAGAAAVASLLTSIAAPGPVGRHSTDKPE